MPSRRSRFFWVVALSLALWACGSRSEHRGEPPEIARLKKRLNTDDSDFLAGLPQERGKEVMYAFLDTGSLKTADLLLADQWELPRFEATELPSPLTWREDPYGEKYWRFVFYSLRPTRHLLYAFLETGDERYRDKLASILRSFDRDAKGSPFVWDKHGVAFRAMVLSNCYWKLRHAEALDGELARILVRLMIEAGEFLAKDDNFEGDYNHGVTQAAALLLVASTLPVEGGVPAWRDLGTKRLNAVLLANVAPDGVQIEQSPGYHFYTLVFFNEIFSWATKHDLSLGPLWAPRIKGMLRFATHITRPDGLLPLLGATQTYRVTGSSKLRELAEADPEFAFVHSSGAIGTKPSENSVTFAESGFTILRSDFGGPEEYRDATHVVFDVGPYRTAHSHLDALHLTLYAAGRPLLVDSGLYSLEQSIAQRYFRGTSAHNTVSVGTKDQRKGSARAVSFRSGAPQDSWAFQSALHDNLYPGVEHRRGVLLLRKDLVVVVDEVRSSSPRLLEQNWNFAPDLALDLESDAVRVSSQDRGDVMTVYQSNSQLRVSCLRGQDDPKQGWHSSTYEKEEPASTLVYGTRAKELLSVVVFASGPIEQRPVKIQVGEESGRWTIDIQGSASTQKLSLSSLATDAETLLVEPQLRKLAPSPEATPPM